MPVNTTSGDAQKPSDEDRARFGLKPRLGKATSMPAPPTVNSTACPLELVDLVKICDDPWLPSTESAKKAMALKRSARRFEFKEQIAELEGHIGPHRTALSDMMSRDERIRQKLLEEQVVVNERLKRESDKLVEQKRLHDDYLRQLKEEHMVAESRWKQQELEKDTFFENKEAELKKCFKEKIGSLQEDHQLEISKVNTKMKLCQEDAKNQVDAGTIVAKKKIAEKDQQLEAAKAENERAMDKIVKEWEAKESNLIGELEHSKLAARRSEERLISEWSEKLEEARHEHENNVSEFRLQENRLKADYRRQLEELEQSRQEALNDAQSQAKARERALQMRLEDIESQKEQEQEKLKEAAQSKLREQQDLFAKKEDILMQQQEQLKEASAKQLCEQQAQSAHKEDLLNQQIVQLTLDMNRTSQNLQAEHAARMRDVKAASERQEQDIRAEGRAEVEAIEAKAQAREAELKRMMEQQSHQAQQERDDVKSQSAMALSEAKRRESDLQAEMNRLMLRSDNLQSDLQTTRENMDGMERKLQTDLDTTISANRKLELELSREKRERECDGLAMAKLQSEHDALLKTDEEKTIVVQDTQSKLIACQKQIAELQREHESNGVAMAKLRKEHDALLKIDEEKTIELQVTQTKHMACQKRVAELQRERDCDGLAIAKLQSEHDALLNIDKEKTIVLQDTQAKHIACEKRVVELQRDLQATQEECERHREAVAEEQASLQKREEELMRSSTELNATREELVSTKAELSRQQQAHSNMKHEKDELEVRYQIVQESSNSTSQALIEDVTLLRLDIERLHQKVDSKEVELTHRASDMAEQRQNNRRLEEELALAQKNKRELHNAIQELKGNIRVICRVRPGPPGAESALRQVEESKLSLRYGPDANHIQNYDYTFDNVFGTKSTQDDLFKEVSGLVQSALDGYKVCLFAYGQTGSGKTFTMQGGDQPEAWGLIPRSLHLIFAEAERLRAAGWQWELKASFLEVYNEVIRDLLRDDDKNATPQCHTIKHDTNWGITATNMTCIKVISMDEIKCLTARAAKMRAVGSTDMNSQSSRSHSVFSLYLSGSNTELDTELRGALHLVDLAGSERLDKSGAVGERLKETQNINKSLSSLSDVFAAKAENREHVPFRNSKLTHLMEPCLSGQGKTLMIVNVGPEETNTHETMCSLRFASQVSLCNTGGKPKRSAKTLSKATGSGAPVSSIALKKRGGA